MSVWALSLAYRKNADRDEDKAKAYELEQVGVSREGVAPLNDTLVKLFVHLKYLRNRKSVRRRKQND